MSPEKEHVLQFQKLNIQWAFTKKLGQLPGVCNLYLLFRVATRRSVLCLTWIVRNPMRQCTAVSARWQGCSKGRGSGGAPHYYLPPKIFDPWCIPVMHALVCVGYML